MICLTGGYLSAIALRESSKKREYPAEERGLIQRRLTGGAMGGERNPMAADDKPKKQKKRGIRASF